MKTELIKFIIVIATACFICSCTVQVQPLLNNAESSAAKTPSAAGSACPVKAKTVFALRSPEVADGGMLPRDYTGDGTSATLPLEWSGAPCGTRSYAVIMRHIDPEGKVKWYWILYNIPANIQSLPKNVEGVGILGNNSINGRLEYAPPHSKGPGAKTYIYTVYALSAPLRIEMPAGEVNRAVLLSAMKDHILGSAELKVVYTRHSNDSNVPVDREIK